MLLAQVALLVTFFFFLPRLNHFDHGRPFGLIGLLGILVFFSYFVAFIGCIGISIRDANWECLFQSSVVMLVGVVFFLVITRT